MFRNCEERFRRLCPFSITNKKFKKKNRHYFNFDLETSSDVKSVVCFSPSKHKIFEDASNDQSGCEIINATLNNDESTIYVSDYSTIHTKELGFTRTNQYDFKRISEVVNEVPLDTKVNVQGAVALEETRHVTVNGDEVAIREGHLIDETGNIKITLWREYTEVESGQTYDFLRLIKIRYAGEVVLQSINSTTYQVSRNQLEGYEVPARVEPNMLDDVAVVAIDISETHMCMICKAPAIPGEIQLYNCAKCRSVMLTSSLRRKSLKKFTIILNSDHCQFNCHDSVLAIAFPTRNIADMDVDQLSLMI